tara:strand:+ start:30 stop:422 length:393 start_codon:yes stop_codon:yes gene_type:complete
MNTRTIESLEDAVEYFLPDAVTKERREKATIQRRKEIAEETAEAKRKKDIADMELVQIPGGVAWVTAYQLREILQIRSEDKERAKLERHTYTNGVAGHGDYGIVHDPCPVHLKDSEYKRVIMWLQENDWL